MTVKINADTSDGLKFVSDTSGEIDLQANGSTKVHMASDGKVGIGETAPLTKLHIGTGVAFTPDAGTDQLIVENNGNSAIQLVANTSSKSEIMFSDTTRNVGGLSYDHGSNFVQFNTNSSERMRINSVGQLQIGTTVERNNSFVCIKSDSTNQNGMEIRTHANNDAIRFYSSDSTSAGAVTVNGSSTTYSTSSDYRLKENVDYTFDATTRLKQLKPCRFNWIADDTNTALDGFIAHEVSSIVPESIIGEKDATKVQDVFDSDGVKTGTETVPEYQGIDQSKLVPLLVKTIQELEARITALES